LIAGYVGHVGATLLNDFPNPVNEILEETDPSVAIRDLSLDDALRQRRHGRPQRA